jgi:hypothetical protein
VFWAGINRCSSKAWQGANARAEAVAADLIDMEGRESGNVAVGWAVALVLELPRCYCSH